MASSFGFTRFAQAKPGAPTRNDALPSPPELPGLDAEQYLIIKNRTSEAIYGRDIYTPKVLASNAKLMTLAVMLDGGLLPSPTDLKRMLTFSDNDLTTTLAAEFMAAKGTAWLAQHGVNIKGVTDESLKRDAMAARAVLGKHSKRDPSNANVLPRDLRMRIDGHFTPLMNRLAKEQGMDTAHFGNTVGAYWHGFEPPSASPIDVANLQAFINEKDPKLLATYANPHDEVLTEGGRKKKHTTASYFGNRPEVVWAKTGSQWSKYYDKSPVGKSLKARYPNGSFVISVGFKGQDGEDYTAFIRTKTKEGRPIAANKMLDLMAEKTRPRPQQKHSPGAQDGNPPGFKPARGL